MRPSTVIRAVGRNLAYDLIDALHQEWRAGSPAVARAIQKLSAYLVAALIISLAIFAVLCAPWHDPDDLYLRHNVVDGLHIVVPTNLRSVPIEQLVPLP